MAREELEHDTREEAKDAVMVGLPLSEEEHPLESTRHQRIKESLNYEGEWISVENPLIWVGEDNE